MGQTGERGERGEQGELLFDPQNISICILNSTDPHFSSILGQQGQVGMRGN